MQFNLVPAYKTVLPFLCCPVRFKRFSAPQGQHKRAAANMWSIFPAHSALMVVPVPWSLCALSHTAAPQHTTHTSAGSLGSVSSVCGAVSRRRRIIVSLAAQILCPMKTRLVDGREHTHRCSRVLALDALTILHMCNRGRNCSNARRVPKRSLVALARGRSNAVSQESA